MEKFLTAEHMGESLMLTILWISNSWKEPGGLCYCSVWIKICLVSASLTPLHQRRGIGVPLIWPWDGRLLRSSPALLLWAEDGTCIFLLRCLYFNRQFFFFSRSCRKTLWRLFPKNLVKLPFLGANWEMQVC